MESFSLSQNAAATREDSNKSIEEKQTRNRVTARSRAAVIAAGSSVRQFGNPHKWLKDDFALRATRESGDSFESFADDETLSRSVRDISMKAIHDQDETFMTENMAHDASSIMQRRKFLHNFVASTAALATATAIDASSDQDHNNSIPPASAFEYTFPVELTSVPLNQDDVEENASNSLSRLQQERLTNKRSKVLATQTELSTDPLGFFSLSSTYDGILLITGISLWTLALWFISGSRSNPLVNPIANILYDVNDSESEWLRERNQGYFSEYPPQLTLVLGMIFICLGVLADRSVYFLADGEVGIPVELGGVAAISGAFWEVGRLAAGEKSSTKEESERDDLVESEFEDFANRRLLTGRSTLSVHRSEVVKAFRRFNPKYRVENDDYPLSDIEIERVVRKWARSRGIDMSSAGFFTGMGIDSAADAFAPR